MQTGINFDRGADPLPPGDVLVFRNLDQPVDRIEPLAFAEVINFLPFLFIDMPTGFNGFPRVLELTLVISLH